MSDDECSENPGLELLQATAMISEVAAIGQAAQFGGGGDDDGGCCEDPASKQTYRIYCKVGPQYAMAIRDGKVVLASASACDDSQHWIKDLKYGADRTDEEGFPTFALINKETGEALKHAPCTEPVILAPFCNDGEVDQTLLWSHSQLFGDNFRTIRNASDIRQNIDAWIGGDEDGILRDGSKVVMFNFTFTDNQLWKVEPYC